MLTYLRRLTFMVYEWTLVCASTYKVTIIDQKSLIPQYKKDRISEVDEICHLFLTETKKHSSVSELWPVCQDGNSEATDAKTREFLKRVVEILLDHITIQNDRSTKIVDFHTVSTFYASFKLSRMHLFSKYNTFVNTKDYMPRSISNTGLKPLIVIWLLPKSMSSEMHLKFDDWLHLLN